MHQAQIGCQRPTITPTKDDRWAGICPVVLFDVSEEFYVVFQDLFRAQKFAAVWGGPGGSIITLLGKDQQATVFLRQVVHESVALPKPRDRRFVSGVQKDGAWTRVVRILWIVSKVIVVEKVSMLKGSPWLLIQRRQMVDGVVVKERLVG